MNAELPALFGVAASFLGVLGSVLLALPTLRMQQDQEALNALALLPEEVIKEGDLSEVARTLHFRLAGMILSNRRDMRWGLILLALAFALLFAESLLALLESARAAS